MNPFMRSFSRFAALATMAGLSISLAAAASADGEWQTTSRIATPQGEQIIQQKICKHLMAPLSNGWDAACYVQGGLPLIAQSTQLMQSTPELLGNLTGRLLMSWLIVFIVMLLVQRGRWRLALLRSVWPWGWLAVLTMFGLGLMGSVAVAMGGG